VVGYCECGDKRSGSGATDSVNYMGSMNTYELCRSSFLHVLDLFLLLYNQ
jgi:hypothetical protein